MANTFTVIGMGEISKTVVTSISTSINSDLLSISNWHNSTLVINTTDDISAPSRMRIGFESPCLSSKFHPKVNTSLYSVDLNGGFFIGDLIKNVNSEIDNTNCPSNKISFLKDRNLVLTNDSSPIIRLYQDGFLGEIKTNAKIVTMDAKDNLIVIATDDYRFFGYDIRNPPHRLFSIKNGIKGIAMDLKIGDKCDQFCVSSSDGRIGVYSIRGPREIVGTIFKGHKVNWNSYNGKALEEGQHFVCPITSLSYPSKEGILASSGLDGMVYIWNLKINKRVNLMTELKGQSVSHIEFTGDGKKLIACVSPVMDCNARMQSSESGLSSVYIKDIDNEKDLGRY